MKWKVLDSGSHHPQYNMDLDQKLLTEISLSESPLVHFYDWEKPSLTHGYFINPSQYLTAKGLESWGIQMGRRPTGGGIVFHLTDLAFSVLIPASHPNYSINTLDNYAFVNQRVAQAILQFKKEINVTFLQTETAPMDPSSRHFCMAKPTIYDVMIEGKKVGGAAQRRTRQGFLHQGTISLAPLPEKFLHSVLKSHTVLQEMKSHSYMLIDELNDRDLQAVRGELRHLLVKEFNTSD